MPSWQKKKDGKSDKNYYVFHIIFAHIFCVLIFLPFPCSNFCGHSHLLWIELNGCIIWNAPNGTRRHIDRQTDSQTVRGTVWDLYTQILFCTSVLDSWYSYWKLVENPLERIQITSFALISIQLHRHPGNVGSEIENFVGLGLEQSSNL